MPELNTRQPAIPYWLHVIRAGFLKSPRVRLTGPQVEQMWGLDPLLCDSLLGALVDARFLRRTRAGVYMRADPGD